MTLHIMQPNKLGMMILFRVDDFQMFQFTKGSKRFIPRVTFVEDDFFESLWCSVNNLMNSMAINFDAVNDFSIGIFLLFDLKMVPLI